MRFESQMSGLLATALLAMTSWASACDLSCSLQRLHSGCLLNASTEGQEAGSMSAEMNMGQENPAATVEADSTRHLGMILLMDVSCGHELCGRSSVAASAVGSDHRELNSSHMPAVSTMHPPLRLLKSLSIRTEASPPKIAAISSISTNLRI